MLYIQTGPSDLFSSMLCNSNAFCGCPRGLLRPALRFGDHLLALIRGAVRVDLLRLLQKVNWSVR